MFRLDLLHVEVALELTMSICKHVKKMISIMVKQTFYRLSCGLVDQVCVKMSLSNFFELGISSNWVATYMLCKITLHSKSFILDSICISRDIS